MNTLHADGRRFLVIAGVCKSFGATRVLHEVSFELARGQFVTLLGPSGCGKTTLLRIIAGLESADAGRLELDGVEISTLPARSRPVNTVFQSYALFPHLDVFENIAFGLRARKIAPSQVRRRVADVIEMLQLDPLALRRTHQLSGGQKQRVALARALVNEPSVLLLDEPLSALDAKLRAEVQIELRRLQRKLGTTFILVTHDQTEAITVSDRVLVMRAGQIEQDGTPQEVYQRPRSRFVAEFLGAANLICGHRTDRGLATAWGTLALKARPDWERGTVAIRPERIRVHRAPPPVNGLPVKVREIVYRGDHCDCFVESGSGFQPQEMRHRQADSVTQDTGGSDGPRGGMPVPPLRIRLDSAAGMSPGDEVWIELPAEHLEVLHD